MASIVARNGKYAVVYYEGNERHPVWKSGLSYAQAEKLKDRKSAEEKKWRDKKKKEQRKSRTKEGVLTTGNAGSNPTDVTLKDFMEEFIAAYGTKHWGDSYYTGNKAKMKNYVYPYLGQHRIVDITAKTIDDYYNFLVTKCVPVDKQGRQKIYHISAGLVRDIHKVLRIAFNQAKRWKYIQQNPFIDADVPDYKSTERPALSPEEFEKILEYTDNDSNYERYMIHVALCIQYYCTTRGGEVGGLQWPDYSPGEKTLHIYKALDRVDKKNLNLPKLIIYYMFPLLNPYNKTMVVLKAPKTEATERFSKLNNLLIGKLDRLKTMQDELFLLDDTYQDNQLIVCQSNGRALMPEQLNRKFKTIIAEMRMRGYKFTSVPENLLNKVVFHSIRAASATKKMKVSNGNIKAVMRAGGWAEPDMVIRYSKTYDKDQVDIVERMEDDYLKTEYAKPSLDTERLLRIFRENPELVAKLLATVE